MTLLGWEKRGSTILSSSAVCISGLVSSRRISTLLCRLDSEGWVLVSSRVGTLVTSLWEELDLSSLAASSDLGFWEIFCKCFGIVFGCFLSSFKFPSGWSLTSPHRVILVGLEVTWFESVYDCVIKITDLFCLLFYKQLKEGAKK